jgi:hypothetical protein
MLMTVADSAAGVLMAYGVARAAALESIWQPEGPG